jgi:hypothetical protein
MQDMEIESLLEEAGYAFNVVSGRYDIVNSAEDDEVADQSSEDIADILEIPLEDLQRWEEEQMEADRAAE